jgi:hypothetical protein
MVKREGSVMNVVSRRGFVKKAIVMGAGVAVFPTVLVPKAQAVWTPRTVVHPNVDNLRVAGIVDSEMTSAIEVGCSWHRQNEIVVIEAVWENIDKLACALAETRNSREAWRTIFVKPPHKSWANAVVAIKTNNIARQHTRSAVMAKVLHVLTSILGVKAPNIHIYDACHGNDMGRYTPFSGLPEGCGIEDTWGGSTMLTEVPAPWRGSGGKARCLRHLVEGSVDILINIAMCKGHSERFGGFTMTMKNHFGTFSPTPGHRNGSQDYLIAINQTPEILGPMNRRSGEVIYPRQQLCLVDALWASGGGPGGNPSHQPNFLAMGVMSPVVDYQVATKFRGEQMGWGSNLEATRRMLLDFGYTEADLPAGGRIIEP